MRLRAPAEKSCGLGPPSKICRSPWLGGESSGDAAEKLSNANERPPGINGPGGLADVVPTRIGSLPPARFRSSPESCPHQAAIWKWCSAFCEYRALLPCCTGQSRLVSKRLPRLLIADCAASAKRC